MKREIVHINLSHFMVAVHEVLEPFLRGRPSVVGNGSLSRGIVMDVSEEAFRAGIRKGSFIGDAKRRLRDVEIIPPDPALYRKAQLGIFSLCREFSPVVEGHGGGHLFIDASGSSLLHRSVIDFAARVKREIGERLSLHPVAAASSSKLVSKVASRVVKPVGMVVVPVGDEQSFLSPQPISLLPGIGVRLSSLFGSMGVDTVGRLAAFSEADLMPLVGKRGKKLIDLSRGIDNSPVIDSSASPRLSTEKFLEEDTSDRDEICAALFRATEELGMELRMAKLSSAGVSLTLHYADGITGISGRRLTSPIFTDREIYSVVSTVFTTLFKRRVRVKGFTIELGRLGESWRQLDLFTPPKIERERNIQGALDSIRNRFGMESVGFAAGAAV